ncbi:MAG: response regulator [Acidobacteriales bacterium]|nr:response regulator [Terriglobales bacterium]
MMKQDAPAGAVVLVVDDDDGVRQVLRLMLESGGYRVLEAADGRKALEQVRSENIDVVMTDLVMPEQEGFETIQAIRRERPSLKVIAMSGAFGGEFLHIAKLLGALSTLQKPLKVEQVLAAVADALAS